MAIRTKDPLWGIAAPREVLSFKLWDAGVQTIDTLQEAHPWTCVRASLSSYKKEGRREEEVQPCSTKETDRRERGARARVHPETNPTNTHVVLQTYP